jgi:heterodisulfide reductase subunit C
MDDIIEYNSRDKLMVEKINTISTEAKPEDCYTCLKCTNGCPANKIFEGFAPHKFQIAAHTGLVDDIIESGILWYCFNCITCHTRCPMLTSPVETIQALTNIAVERGMTPPKAFIEMIRNISTEGTIIKAREVQTTDFDFVDREELGLPSREIKDIAKFQAALKEIGALDVLDRKQTEEKK